MKLTRSKRIRSQLKRASSKAEPTYAGSLRRLAAIFYDCILLIGILFTATALLIILNNGEAFKPGNFTYTTALGAISVTFFSWFWVHGGQTLGMRAWKIRIERSDGSPCGTRTAIFHLAVGVILGLLLGMGWWFALIDRKGRALQDVICGTRVVIAD